MDFRLACTRCGREAAPSAFRCGRCGSILEVKYRTGAKPRLKRAAKGMPLGRYIDFLPVRRINPSLGEGGTPLKRIKIEGTDVFLKLEMHNPTKTFKDRGSAIEIARAKELGVKSVCCASTGNMGLSVARYARSAGMKCTIFISKDANRAKISKIKSQGARTVLVDGDFNASLTRAEVFGVKAGAFVCGDYHFRKEGQKTVAYEIAEQLAPDYIFMPVGNATLFAGAYKGLLEFKKAGLIKKIPKLVAVQSEGCDPLVRAFATSRKIRYVRPATEADAIAVGYPTFGFEALHALKSTRGFAISVSEVEIEKAVVELEKFGVYSELGGGAGFAGFIKAREAMGPRLSGRKIAVIITGNNEGRFKM